MGISLKDLLLEKTDTELESDLTNLFKQEYKKFISNLGSFSRDSKFRKFIKSGEVSKSTIRRKAIPVSNLVPTQNEIDLDKSLQYPLTHPEMAESYLKGGDIVVAKPIVTFEGQYIIDGHHRWSQLYAMNPKAKIVVIDFDNPNIESPHGALKAMQLAIVANDTSKLPMEHVEGHNILEVNEKVIYKYVIDKISDGTLAVMKKYNVANSKEEAAEYILDNIKQLKKTSQPIDNAPNRGLMPQPDDAPGGLLQTMDTLRSGIKMPTTIAELTKRVANIINESRIGIPGKVEKNFNIGVRAMADKAVDDPRTINLGGCGAVAKLLYYAIKKKFNITPEIIVLGTPHPWLDSKNTPAAVSYVKNNIDSADNPSDVLHNIGYLLGHVVLKIGDYYIDSNGIKKNYPFHKFRSDFQFPIKIETLNKWVRNSNNWNDTFSRVNIPNLATYIDKMMAQVDKMPNT